MIQIGNNTFHERGLRVVHIDNGYARARLMDGAECVGKLIGYDSRRVRIIDFGNFKIMVHLYNVKFLISNRDGSIEFHWTDGGTDVIKSSYRKAARESLQQIPYLIHWYGLRGSITYMPLKSVIACQKTIGCQLLLRTGEIFHISPKCVSPRLWWQVNYWLNKEERLMEMVD
jgi:hypothetical protein